MVLGSSIFDDILKEKIEEIEKSCKEIEERTNYKVVLLLMAEGWASIERDSVDDIYKYIKNLNLSGKKGIIVILHSTGGDADAAYHISEILNTISDKSELIFLVPRLAKSAATLLSCSGDKIVMTGMSELGPIDPQVEIRPGRWISVTTVTDALKEIFTILEEKRSLKDNYIEALFRALPLTEVGQFDKLIKYIKDLLFRVLKKRMMKDKKDDEIEKICEKLTKGYEYHGMPITAYEAKNIGLNVEIWKNEEDIIINKIYSSFKALTENLEKTLIPILSVLPVPIPTSSKIVTKYGLIYLPPYDLFKETMTH